MADVDNSDTDLTARFGLAVKDARERASLTQQQLAHQAGASLNHIGKIERGKYLPGLHVAARIIVVLGIDANKLFGTKVQRRKASRRRLQDEAELIQVIEQLDDKALATAAELVAVLAKRGK